MDKQVARLNVAGRREERKVKEREDRRKQGEKLGGQVQEKMCVYV